MSEAIIPSITAPTVVVVTTTEHVVAVTTVQDVIATAKRARPAAPLLEIIACLDADVLTGREGRYHCRRRLKFSLSASDNAEKSAC
jgi:hypothetical protein